MSSAHIHHVIVFFFFITNQTVNVVRTETRVSAVFKKTFIGIIKMTSSPQITAILGL